VKSQLGLKTLESVLVVHCAHAYAAVLEGESGWKVAFSGDTRPCEQMVHAAKDATLLIHEVRRSVTYIAQNNDRCLCQNLICMTKLGIPAQLCYAVL